VYSIMGDTPKAPPEIQDFGGSLLPEQAEGPRGGTRPFG
jgi:hypothetical protein